MTRNLHMLGFRFLKPKLASHSVTIAFIDGRNILIDSTENFISIKNDNNIINIKDLDKIITLIGNLKNHIHYLVINFFMFMVCIQGMENFINRIFIFQI